MTWGVEESLARIAEGDPRLCAFLEVWEDAAPSVEGRELPLYGMPFAVKGRAGLRSYAARKLIAAGAVPVGSTSVPGPGTYWQTWGLGAKGRTLNPYRPDLTPGGSSAGSAVAVAAGMVPLATGSDGAGSVRIPAAWCGVFGLRTTRGLLPSPDRTGLATAGVLGRSAAELEAYLGCAVEGYEAAPRASLPTRAVWSADLGVAAGPELDAEVVGVARRAAERLFGPDGLEEAAGFALRDPKEEWFAMRGGARPGAVAEWNAAQLSELFDGATVLATPVTPFSPHGHEGPGGRFSTALTWAFNVSGHPAVSIPAGFTADGCPVGLQLVAGFGAEAVLVGVAARADGRS
ncbi:amidase [Streptomyces sp. NBC_00237]|uniref:amidase family protein n=1 Tax=Streptomyces sp. NBC_00237 TaxID=2975687 RepID=UPI00225587C0|nr:amidase [Streptomyces sp. NBC_00237]MCX5204225.1 amidase [Streptomyces sp. NBC_00237]